MKIVVLGTRGFPDVQGGVEKHCENLYPSLVKLGCEVTVLDRKPYVGNKEYSYQGVNIKPLACPKHKFIETFLHILRGVLQANKLKPDILHIHAIGPSLFIPLARLFGLRVIMTHHGPDYQRKKWNKFAKALLKLGEYLGVRYANKVIVISEAIAENIKKKYGRQSVVIPNGVVIPHILGTQNVLNKYGLGKGKYILAVGRIVPEKGFHDLIDAFNQLQLDSWKLVIVGKADHEDRYSLSLQKKAGMNSNIVLTGFLAGIPLQELYSHAGIFILPSYYEGMPIVLLEAMSYGLSCIVSDIAANKVAGLCEERLFKVGNIEALAIKIKEFINQPLNEEAKAEQLNMISEIYDWGKIADKTLKVYNEFMI